MKRMSKRTENNPSPNLVGFPKIFFQSSLVSVRKEVQEKKKVQLQSFGDSVKNDSVKNDSVKSAI